MPGRFDVFVKRKEYVFVKQYQDVFIYKGVTGRDHATRLWYVILDELSHSIYQSEEQPRADFGTTWNSDTVDDDGRVRAVGFVSLWPVHSSGIHHEYKQTPMQITMCSIKRTHRERGIAKALYLTIIQDNVLLLSDYEQTFPAARIWNSLMNDSTVIVRIYDWGAQRFIDKERANDIECLYLATLAPSQK